MDNSRTLLSDEELDEVSGGYITLTNGTYYVWDDDRKHLLGEFPTTKQGLRDAKAFAKKHKVSTETPFGKL